MLHDLNPKLNIIHSGGAKTSRSEVKMSSLLANKYDEKTRNYYKQIPVKKAPYVPL